VASKDSVVSVFSVASKDFVVSVFSVASKDFVVSVFSVAHRLRVLRGTSRRAEDEHR
jgi:hypothetical protein